MRFLFPCFAILLTAFSMPQHNHQSRFVVSGSAVEPTTAVTGPEDIVGLVRMVDQPDSPLQILALDFTGSSLFVSNERETEQLRCTMKIRNRSDQHIRGVRIDVTTATSSGGGGTGFEADRDKWAGLEPGEETEVRACGGGGSGSALGNHVRILVLVHQVEMENYFYVPSKLIPFELGVSPIGL